MPTVASSLRAVRSCPRGMHSVRTRPDERMVISQIYQSYIALQRYQKERLILRARLAEIEGRLNAAVADTTGGMRQVEDMIAQLDLPENTPARSHFDLAF